MAKGRNPGYIPGDHWVICDRCGFAYRNSEMKKQWDGLIVCPSDFETRHPQDFVRGRNENMTPKGFVRPEPVQDTFVSDPGFQDTTGNPDYEKPEGTF